MCAHVYTRIHHVHQCVHPSHAHTLIGYMSSVLIGQKRYNKGTYKGVCKYIYICKHERNEMLACNNL